MMGENPQFLPYFQLRVVAPSGNVEKKLNAGAKLQTFPYPTTSKPILSSVA